MVRWSVGVIRAALSTPPPCVRAMSAAKHSDAKQLKSSEVKRRALFRELGQKFTPHPKNIARRYYDVNMKQNPAHFAYDELELPLGNIGDYEVLQKVGQGRYSWVFAARNATNGKMCTVKIMKPVSKRRVKRELCILQNICGGPNVPVLYEALRDDVSRVHCLVYEWVHAEPWQSLRENLTPQDVKHYCFELLRALHHAHSNGIIHRDLKPQNLLIDPAKRTVRLIDWGLAEFYFPGAVYPLHVATRYYKAPELLTGMSEYNYGLDMWAFGCTLAQMVFRMNVLFKGKDDEDQLIQIAKVLGRDPLVKYLKQFNLALPPSFETPLANFAPKPWRQFVTLDNERFATPAALDVLSRLLVYDPRKRMTVDEALEHQYFDEPREKLKLNQPSE